MFDLEADAFPELERQGPRPFPNEGPPLHNMPERDPGNASRILASVSFETLSAEERRCTICLQDIGDGDADSPVRLPCLHVFGDRCIKRWLEEEGTCPLCRYDYSNILWRREDNL